MKSKHSELTVITKAKDLCSYIMTVTQKSPKQFEQISRYITDCRNLLGAWMNSYRRRLSSDGM